jgi:nicotinamide-nucleotide amidase
MPTGTIENCVRLLISQGRKIAFAESATAGRLASEFALVPESGKVLLGGIVCYDPEVKTSILKVPKKLIDDFTAESAEVTQALAENLTAYFDADIFVAVTGLASPGGSETPEKPIGTMFFHVILSEGAVAHREVFEGNPEEVVLHAIDRVCSLISEKLATPNPK